MCMAVCALALVVARQGGLLSRAFAATTRRGAIVRDPETPRDSGWPTGSGQPLGGLNVVESVYGITGA